MKTQLKNTWDKRRAAENEINFKNCHHLFFFYLELKNKKIYLHCLFIAKKILPINCVNVIFILLLSFEQKKTTRSALRHISRYLLIFKSLDSFGTSLSLRQTFIILNLNLTKAACSVYTSCFYSSDKNNKQSRQNSFWQSQLDCTNTCYILLLVKQLKMKQKNKKDNFSECY